MTEGGWSPACERGWWLRPWYLLACTAVNVKIFSVFRGVFTVSSASPRWNLHGVGNEPLRHHPPGGSPWSLASRYQPNLGTMPQVAEWIWMIILDHLCDVCWMCSGSVMKAGSLTRQRAPGPQRLVCCRCWKPPGRAGRCYWIGLLEAKRRLPRLRASLLMNVWVSTLASRNGNVVLPKSVHRVWPVFYIPEICMYV